MRKIRLMADYECWPLWGAISGKYGDINPDDLPISSTLRISLIQWAADYDATLVRDDPKRSGFATPEAKTAFSDIGLRLRNELAAELGSAFQVTYQA